ncbi:MD-2-related lipid-recognition [Schizopora paradoxa]|uniref:Phosphatidylglycerol/phosphatidylinositol transfer protein n=1 Tax=Schizopora paradoxa TaxID=27342 RepID=A0A0H2S7F4_9AGAM|nr:MD-2-related lipid-recognition [Schizopora paradoxa]
MAAVLQENSILDNASPIRTTASWQWQSCGDDTYDVDIKSISISPDPPQKGQDLNVTVSGTVKKEVDEGAYALVQVKVGAIKILTKEIDICEEARNSDMELQCPVKEGDYTVKQTAQLPKEIPPGKFKVTIEGFTVEDENLVCVDIDVDFRMRFPHIW